MLETRRIKYLGWSFFTTDKLILFFFLLVNVGLYYSKYLFLITPTYILLSLGFVHKIVSKRKLIYNRYIGISIVFGLFAYLSTLWANDASLALENSLTLLKFIFISIMLITLLDKKENVEFALWMLAISGLVYTLLYLANWDVSALGFNRAGTALTESDIDLPNLNVVGLITANSFVCLLFFYFIKKNNWALLLASIAFIAIFFIGSRKSIIFIFIGVLMMFFKLKRSSKLSLTILFAVLVELVLLFIPPDYFSFIWERFGDLKFFSKVSNLDYSDQLRVDFITHSVNYFNSQPIFGHGYYNFASLFYKDKGIAVYSHNNFIETGVGLGVIGLVIYYSLYFIIARQITWSKKMDFSYLFMILLILNMFNHFFIVVSNDRFTWMLLPIMYAGTKWYSSKDNFENVSDNSTSL